MIHSLITIGLVGIGLWVVLCGIYIVLGLGAVIVMGIKELLDYLTK